MKESGEKRRLSRKQFQGVFCQAGKASLSLSCTSEESHVLREQTRVNPFAVFSHWLGAVCGKHGLRENVVVDAEGQELEHHTTVLTAARDLSSAF